MAGMLRLQMGNTGRNIQRIIFLAAYITVLLVMVELILRKYLPIDNPIYMPPMTSKLSENRRIGYELREGVGDNNSDGLRDIEYSTEKAAGVTRIIVVGDSIAYGLGVSREETYTTRLENILNHKYGDTYEVINLGVNGYWTVQIYERFKDKGLKYKPDIVIYGYCHNDFLREGTALFQQPFFSGVLAPLWESYMRVVTSTPFLKNSTPFLKNIRIEIFSRIVCSIFVISHFFSDDEQDGSYQMHTSINDEKQFFYNLLNRSIEEMVKTECPIYVDNGTLKMDDFSEYFQAFQNLSNLCKAQDIRLILLTTPIIASDFDEYCNSILNSYTRRLAEYFKIETLDTFNYFAKRNLNYILYSWDITHFNAFGHRIVAEAIAEYLEDSKGMDQSSPLHNRGTENARDRQATSLSPQRWMQ